jgi:hypothetical protein
MLMSILRSHRLTMADRSIHIFFSWHKQATSCTTQTVEVMFSAQLKTLCLLYKHSYEAHQPFLQPSQTIEFDPLFYLSVTFNTLLNHHLSKI